VFETSSYVSCLHSLCMMNRFPRTGVSICDKSNNQRRQESSSEHCQNLFASRATRIPYIDTDRTRDEWKCIHIVYVHAPVPSLSCGHPVYDACILTQQQTHAQHQSGLYDQRHHHHVYRHIEERLCSFLRGYLLYSFVDS